MHVLALNGSPKKKGNTYAALAMVGEELQKESITVDIVNIGSVGVRGCLACNKCVKNQNERCVIDDEVNEWIQFMKKADGILLGSPVHYADISGAMKSFLDRAFYVTSVNNRMLRHKVGGSVIAVRRSGGVSAFSTLNNYLLYQEMFLAGSNYWNVIHGTAPGEVAQDSEGRQIMRILGRNMAWLMKTVRLGRETLPVPEMEPKIFTHFVR